MAGQTVNVAVLAETARFAKSMADAGDSADHFGGRFKNVALGIGVAIAGAIAGAVKIGIESEKSLERIETLNAQTGAAISSTGGAAGRSLDQINALNGSLERLTGVEAESIQEGQNVLLTFTNIKGTTFDAATKSALDMSVALGTDTKTAALQLGKALNDPVAGVTKLSKVGVTFTEQQKDQIAAMSKVGDTAGAQAIILGELQKEFGGSAEAYGSTVAGLRAKVGNELGTIGESLTSGFMPAIKSGLTFLNGFLVKLNDSKGFNAFIASFSGFLQELFSGQGPIASFVKSLVVAAAAASPLGNVLRFIGQNADQVGPIFATIAKVLSGALAAALPIIVQLVSALASTFAAILPAVAQLAKTLGAALVQVILALAPLLVLVAQALAQILPILAPLIVQLLQLATPIIALIGPLLTPLIQLLTLLLVPILDLAGGLLKLLVPALSFLVGGLTEVVNFISGKGSPAISALGDLLSGAFTAVIKALGVAWSAVWSGIASVFTTYITGVRIAVSALVGFFSGVWSSIVSGITGFGTAVGNGVGVVVGFVASIPSRFVAGLGNIARTLQDAGGQIINGLITGVQNQIGQIGSIAANIGKRLLDGVKGALGIHSPSREMGKLGAFAVAGLANALAKTAPVTSAMQTLSNAVTDGFDADLTTSALTSGGSLRGGNQYVVHVSTLNPTPEAGRVIAEALNDYQRVNGVRS